MAGTQGWWIPKPDHPTARYHWIGEDGRSLCGRWLHLIGPMLFERPQKHCERCAWILSGVALGMSLKDAKKAKRYV